MKSGDVVFTYDWRLAQVLNLEYSEDPIAGVRVPGARLNTGEIVYPYELVRIRYITAEAKKVLNQRGKNTLGGAALNLDYQFNRSIQIKDIKCGICKEAMVKMLARDKTEYFKCNGCGAETWPELKDDTPEKIGKAARRVYRESTSGIMKPKSKKSGGSRTKRRKKPVKPIPVSQRFKLE